MIDDLERLNIIKHFANRLVCSHLALLVVKMEDSIRFFAKNRNSVSDEF